MSKLILKKRISLFLMTAVICTLGFAGGCKKTSDKNTLGNALEIVKNEKWTEVGKNIYVFTGEFYLVNMALVVSGKDAVLIDTGMDIAECQNVMGFLEERGLKLKNIIITHMHGDHKGNLWQFESNDMVPITPENAEDNQILKVGNEKLRIIFTEGHYQPHGHISVEVEKENVLIAGDVICNNIIPPIAAGGDIDELLKTLKLLQDKNYSAIVPGHGEVVENDLIFKRQFEYLNNARNKVEELIKNGGKIEDLNTIKLTDCIEDTSYLYDERLDYWHEESLSVIYLQLNK